MYCQKTLHWKYYNDAFIIPSILQFDTTLLASRDRELQILALKFGQVLTLMTVSLIS